MTTCVRPSSVLLISRELSRSRPNGSRHPEMAAVPPMTSYPVETEPLAAPTAEDARWLTEEVQPHGSSLRSYLRRRFPWLTEVDDIAQEALFRIWRRRRTSGERALSCPKAALFVVARNVAYD